MVYYKKFFLIFLFSLLFLFLINSNVFAYSFIDKNGQVYETSGSPQYDYSPIQIVTYYDGYYYFITPNVPNQNNNYWYLDNGYLSNSWLIDDDILSPLLGLYCARIEDGSHLSWSPYDISNNNNILFYENLTYNNCPIYDFYGSSFVIKPSMSLSNLNGMGLGVEQLTLSLNGSNLFNIFTYSLPFLAIVIFVILGFSIIGLLLKKFNH